MAGSSGPPLVKKLGIDPGDRICVMNAPPGYFRTLGALPAGVRRVRALQKSLDFVHVFTDSRKELESIFADLKESIDLEGMVWISWPKKSSGVETDLTEDVIRELGLGIEMVDVKVCAIDDTWSGLKFVIRVEDRE